MSIGWKKLKDNIYSLLNPDTYSKTSIPSLKHWIIINQNYMILGAFVVQYELFSYSFLPLYFVLEYFPRCEEPEDSMCYINT